MTDLETLRDPDYINDSFAAILQHESLEVATEVLTDIVGRFDASETEGQLRRTLEQEPGEMVAEMMRDPVGSFRRQILGLRKTYDGRTITSTDMLGSTYERFATRDTYKKRVDSEHTIMTTERGEQRLRVASHLRGQLLVPARFMLQDEQLAITTQGWHRGQPTTIEHTIEDGEYGANLLVGIFTNTMLAQYMQFQRSDEQTRAADHRAVVLQLAHEQKQRFC